MFAQWWPRLTAPPAALVHWRFFKPTVFLACLVPAAILAYGLLGIFVWERPDALGPDPANHVLHETGGDALTLLFITLSVTPVRRLLKLNHLQSVRRMLGVWTFTYALLHLTAYFVFNQNCYSFETCEGRAIWADLVKRKFIFIGMFTFTILLALAITSTKGWLHRLIYLAVVTALIHFAWGQKKDISEPILWATGLVPLFGLRLYWAWRKRIPVDLLTH
jgi:sulfoxide reductase heme-binding subunit YedZ